MGEASFEELEAIALVGVKAAAELVPKVADMSALALPELTRVLWPRGSPRLVTWKAVKAAHVVHIRAVRDEILAKDRQSRKARSDAAVSPAVAGAIAQLEEHAQRIEAAATARMLDDLVFERGVPESFTLAELLAKSAGVVLAIAELTAVASYPALRAGRGTFLLRTLRAYLSETALLLIRIEYDREISVLEPAQRAVNQLLEPLEAEHERILAEVTRAGVPPDPRPAPREPRLGPRAAGSKIEIRELSVDDSLRELAFLASETRRAAPVVAAATERVLFPQGAPRTMTLVALTEAIDRVLGKATPAQSMEAIRETDALVAPEDPDEAVSVSELFDAIAESIATARERVLELDEAERAQHAFSILLHARLLALHVVAAAQASGQAALVARLAAELDLVPLPGVEPLGSA